MMNSIINKIQNVLGKEYAKNYHESIPFFKAKFESDLKGRYFLESTQFVSSTGERLPREYHLKCIGSHVRKIIEFKSKAKAFSFFNNAEFLSSGALVLERYLLNSIQFYAKVNNSHYECLYDNGLTSCFTNWFNNTLITYCEGDVVEIHCATDEIFENEKQNHLNYFKEH